ncbi:hypothetical protein [Novosphingobium terrae]|uniref:hypothetical protein n=1 Tax=Novosphingobium terrae TaxID=2726189 RepID=UPI0019822B1A|nr:hypothetical protein [Novosphingobium terrae]
MKEIDLSGVDAMRRPEARRRVGVVVDFLRIASPTDADRADHAAKLGLSVNQFSALVRAWRMHGSAAKLAGSGAHRGSSRRPSRLSVPAKAKDEAKRIIAAMGVDAPFVRIHEAVLARCVELKVSPPSRSTLWNMVMASRSQPHDGGEGIVVGTCAIRLPMLREGDIVMPMISLAVRTADGAVVAAALGNGQWSEFLACKATEAMPVRADMALLHAGQVDGVTAVLPSAARTELSRVVGRGIAGIKLLYQPSKAIKPARLLKTKDDQPLTEADMHDVVFAALSRHNESRRATAPIEIESAS